MLFALGNMKPKPSIDKKSPFIVTNAFVSLITRFKWFYNLIIDFKFNFFTFFVKTDYNWMFSSGNMKRIPSIDQKSPFIVTNAFKSFISPFKWLYNLITYFKLNFFTFWVKTDYNWMFTSGNVKLKPSINRKSLFIVTHAFKSLITRFKWFPNLIIDFELNVFIFF